MLYGFVSDEVLNQLSREQFKLEKPSVPITKESGEIFEELKKLVEKLAEKVEQPAAVEDGEQMCTRCCLFSAWDQKYMP